MERKAIVVHLLASVLSSVLEFEIDVHVHVRVGASFWGHQNGGPSPASDRKCLASKHSTSVIRTRLPQHQLRHNVFLWRMSRTFSSSSSSSLLSMHARSSCTEGHIKDTDTLQSEKQPNGARRSWTNSNTFSFFIRLSLHVKLLRHTSFRHGLFCCTQLPVIIGFFPIPWPSCPRPYRVS